ncbi:TPA: DUF4176 domain-containing protein [Streptococcus suis]
MPVERQHLPIGTIVKLKDGVEPLMIVSLFPVTTKEDKMGYFDFGGAPLPIGGASQELAFFNKSDIEEVSNY